MPLKDRVPEEIPRRFISLDAFARAIEKAENIAAQWEWVYRQNVKGLPHNEPEWTEHLTLEDVATIQAHVQRFQEIRDKFTTRMDAAIAEFDAFEQQVLSRHLEE